MEVAMATTIKVNGVDRTVDVDSDTPLLWVLRDVLGMTGTKFGCGLALCGACTVHVDGKAVRSCVTPLSSLKAGQKVVTLEGLGFTGIDVRRTKVLGLVFSGLAAGIENSWFRYRNDTKTPRTPR
jgi:aerobic-type carbon monoxide dehydrogenase small subunit (CoxS/CutS family)